MSVKLSWAMIVGGFPCCSLPKRPPAWRSTLHPTGAVSHRGLSPRCYRHCEAGAGACHRKTII